MEAKTSPRCIPAVSSVLASDQARKRLRTARETVMQIRSATEQDLHKLQFPTRPDLPPERTECHIDES